MLYYVDFFIEKLSANQIQLHIQRSMHKIIQSNLFNLQLFKQITFKLNISHS